MRTDPTVTTRTHDSFDAGGRQTAMLAASALAGFLVLAAMALTAEPALLRVDRAVEAIIIAHRTPWLDHLMVGLTFLGSRYAIGAASAGLLVWSLVTRRNMAFVLVIIGAVLVNPLFEIVAKELVGRVRPTLAQLLPGNGPSFPSGHVLAAVGFYGLMPLLAREATSKSSIRLAAVVGSAVVIAMVAVSRPYLDVHWTTDAIAGVLLGTVLVAATHQVYVWLSAGEQVPPARK